MIYLYGYLGIGAVLFLVLYGHHRLSQRNASESLADVLDAIDSHRHPLSHCIVNQVLVPGVAIVLVIVAWPVAVIFKVKARLDQQSRATTAAERVFRVESQHLLERLSVPEIERREIVVDPLQAVPELPFGHLNAAWQGFLKDCSEDDEVWSFAARWQTQWGRRERRSGYVKVRHGAPGAYFLTVWKEFPDEKAFGEGADGA